MLFLGYPRCSTSNRAQMWLDKNGIEYEYRNIKEVNPTVVELKDWYCMSGLPLKRFFNTSGMLYKELHLKDRLSILSEEEQIQLLASNGMLIKRPIIVGEDFIMLGFREEAWREKLL